MNPDPVYESFVTTRQRLLERSAAAREELNKWIEMHRTLDVSLTDLAQLEALLMERRSHLTQLVELDDKFMDHLIERRHRISQPD